METAAMIAAVHKYVEAFETGSIDLIREIYSSDARVEDPVGSEVHDGIEAVCAFYEGALGSGAKLVLTGAPRCAGNSVAFPFKAEMPGMHVEIIDVFEFNHEGKVNSMRAYWGPENMIS